MTTQTLTVPQTIKAQIGVWAFAEVGARNFMADGQSLFFDAKPRHRIVRVIVTLAADDTYFVRVLKNAGRSFDILKEYKGIYADQLPAIIRNLPQEV